MAPFAVSNKDCQLIDVVLKKYTSIIINCKKKINKKETHIYLNAKPFKVKQYLHTNIRDDAPCTYLHRPFVYVNLRARAAE